MSNKSKKTGIKDWYQGLRGEFNKISWPDRETLTRETVTVTVVSIVIGVIIAMLDMVLQYGISFLV
ncbi:MAG: preprotein translocase subunit SecE [Eubacterium sp.]|nr:preprotein translocase subunit SecE [Eubacterium sp.]